MLNRTFVISGILFLELHIDVHSTHAHLQYTYVNSTIRIYLYPYNTPL
jgi:hypothetical protein